MNQQKFPQPSSRAIFRGAFGGFCWSSRGVAEILGGTQGDGGRMAVGKCSNKI